MDPNCNLDDIGWLDREPEYWDLINELLEMREETAEAVGRHQYVYHVSGEAAESGSSHKVQEARDEVCQIEDELRTQIVAAARLTC